MAVQALSSAISGTQAIQLQIDNISANISNAGSISFKRTGVNTTDLFYTNLKKAGILENAEASPRPIGTQIGMGTKVTGTYRNMEMGPLKQTFQPLDIAITGTGYFAIAQPNGRVGYTRAGNFQRDAATGNIITSDGNPLANAIAIPNNIHTEDIIISDSGMVAAPDPDNPSGPMIEIGQIEIVTFTNEAGLEAMGHGIFTATVASGEAVALDNTNHKFKQNFLEESNVKSVIELTDLIEAQRNYELNLRVISTVDKVMEASNKI